MTSPLRPPLAVVAAGALLFTLLLLGPIAATAIAQEEVGNTAVMQALAADREAPHNLAPMAATPCVGGFAGSYPCDEVDLLAFMPLANIGGGSGNDIWGWTDPVTGKEWAIMGRTNGTAFVDISDPENPVYVGNLPTQTSNSSWRDIKVYADHAFIGSEAGSHGVQIFDLTQLRSVTSPPQTFSTVTDITLYSGVGSTHNLVINEDSGYLFAVGSAGGTQSGCSGGLHMVDISTPSSPTFAGCFSTDGYTHDAQCVIYNGPDTEHTGKEICFNSNEDTLTIVDVTNKGTPVQLSRTGYSGSRYTHQGWLTTDQAYFLLDDELDEQQVGHNTRTRVWDVSNLDAPSMTGFFDSSLPAIDHNLYVKDNYVFQANYRAGLRILSLDDLTTGSLSEVGFFDIYPSSNSASFNGAWSNYPYYDSGVVVVSGMEQGLFILQPTGLVPDFTVDVAAASLDFCGDGSQNTPVAIGSLNGFSSAVTLSSSGAPAGATLGFLPNPVSPPGNSTLTLTTSGVIAGSYPITVTGTGGGLMHDDAFTLNVSSAAPGAPGLTDPADGATGIAAGTSFSWTAVANTLSYSIEIATDPAFANIVASASGLAGTSFTPAGPLADDTIHYWRVRAANGCGAGPDSAIHAFRTAAPTSFCRQPNAPISTAAPAVDDLVLGSAGTLTDLDLYLDIPHTWVGDLIVNLTHVDTATSATLIDRPGVPASNFGCSGDDILATLDDAAATPVENECAAGIPTIQGTFSPNDPLAAFNGETLAGTWRLTVTDAFSGDNGTLVEWCLQPTVSGGGASADYSDSASQYGVAWHDGDGTLRLGLNWDADTTFAAGSDDADDDGLAYQSALVPGTTTPLTATVTRTDAGTDPAWLTIWFDWNADGDLADAGEKGINQQVAVGDNVLSVNTPVGAATGSGVLYRARLYDSPTEPAVPAAGKLAATSDGGANGGEVTDGFSPPPTPTAVTLRSAAAARTAISAATVLALLLATLGVAHLRRRRA